MPVIVDSSGNTIVPSDTDDTYLGYEPITGVNVYASERLLNNFQVFNDELFSIVNNSPDFGTFLPLLYVVRQFKMTDE